MTDKGVKYFFCVGAQKAGTTYLHNLLKQHDGIAVSRFKELHYFNHYLEYRKGIDGFTAKYDMTQGIEYLADFTPEYMLKPEYLQRIFDTVGDKAKIVVLLRDPVKRAFSQFKMKLKNSNKPLDFHKLITGEISKKIKPYSMTARGLYAEHLENIYSIFKAENVLALRFEDITKDTDNVLRTIFNFLDIEFREINTDVWSNPAKNTMVSVPLKLYYKIPFVFRRKLYDINPWFKKRVKRAIDSSTRERDDDVSIEPRTEKILKEYFKASNMRLKDGFGIDTDKWL